MLGADGLGIVFVGFASYLVALGLQRALVVDPLIARSSAEGIGESANADRCALTVVLVGSCVATATFVLIGLLASTKLTQGMLLFGAWLVPALVQDFVRSLLFRDRRGNTAAKLELLWLGTFVALLPIAYAIGASWALVCAWGAGALVAASFGLVLLRSRPQRLRPAVTWWSANALVLGKWIFATSVVYLVSFYATTLILAVMLGAAELGGLRAVLSAMTPLSLIAPVFSLAGLPALSRAVTRSGVQARRLATRLGGAAGLLAAVYVAIMTVAPGILGLLFGDAFNSYADLVGPLGVGQVVTALSIGFILLLKAEQRGVAFFACRSTAAICSLLIPVALAQPFGLSGAAWGLTIASLLGATLTAVVSLAHPDRRKAVTPSGSRVPTQGQV